MSALGRSQGGQGGAGRERAPFIHKKAGFQGDIKEFEDQMFDLISGLKQTIKNENIGASAC
jgi:hypothetical protein